MRECKREHQSNGAFPSATILSSKIGGLSGERLLKSQNRLVIYNYKIRLLLRYILQYLLYLFLQNRQIIHGRFPAASPMMTRCAKSAACLSLFPEYSSKRHIQGFVDFTDTLKNMVQTFRITHHNATMSFFTSRLNVSLFKVRMETTSTGLLISSETSSLKSN